MPSSTRLNSDKTKLNSSAQIIAPMTTASICLWLHPVLLSVAQLWIGGSNNTHCKQVTNNAANILDNYTCNSSEPYWSVTCGMRSVCSGFRGFGEGRPGWAASALPLIYAQRPVEQCTSRAWHTTSFTHNIPVFSYEQIARYKLHNDNKHPSSFSAECPWCR